MNKRKGEYTIVFDLVYHVDLNRHIPYPKIVAIENDGTLGILKADGRDLLIVESYNISLETNEPLNKAIHLVNEIHPEVLQKKYNNSRKRIKPLSSFLADPKISKVIMDMVDRTLNKFYTMVKTHHLHIVENIERKTRLQQLVIIPSGTDVDPILHFDKTQLGIKYSMKLDTGDGIGFSPMSKMITILTNDNPWVVCNYNLYRLTSINGNKLRPFLTKEYIFIKNDLAVEYFKKFIVPIAGKLDIESSGFDIIKENKIQEVSLSTSFDFFEGCTVLNIAFDYGRHLFYYHDIQDKRSKLNISKQGKISINQVIRDRHAEQNIIDQLIQLGLTSNNNKRLTTSANIDPHFVIRFLSKHKKELTSLGISLKTPTVDGKPLTIDDHKITITKTLENDWFDIMGVVEIGEQRVPFAHLLKNINADDRLYKLDNETYFLIPVSWMTKYKDLAKYGIEENGKARIRKSQYTIVEDIEEDDTSTPTVNKDIIAVEDIEYVQSPHLRATLRPYQLYGVKWLISHQQNQLGACLADDMGLGKTLQTIAVLSYTKDRLQRHEKSSSVQMNLFGEQMLEEISPLRALIILPASLVYNWYNEIKKFNPSLHTSRHVGPKRNKDRKAISQFDIVLTTYNTAHRDSSLLEQVEWEYIILDESQMIKNKDSKLFKSINTLNAVNKISLSGTPIENSLSDLWAQMQFINPNMLSSFAFFKSNYQTPIEKLRDEDAGAELARMVQPYILRRTKEEVAKDLPPLSEKIEYIELGKKQSEVYEKVKSATRNFLLGLDDSDSSYKFHVFAALTKLRQIANHPTMVQDDYTGDEEKLSVITDQMESVIKSGHKVLVFSSFTKLLDIYKKQATSHNWKYVSLTGGDTQSKREKAVYDFQKTDDVSIFFISLKAGGVGLNLTAADYVFILDPWWNPFAEKQAIARAHRIGQTKPVTVIKYISKDTIEEKIIALQNKKQTLSDDILNFEEGKMRLEKGDLESLLN